MTVIEIIINSGKYTTVNCVIKNLTKDSIVYKQNVFQILKKNGIVADNFDDYFEAGLQKLI
ncbi:MAG: hypothetical protein U9N49_08835, partial [Campylobacterota bacterium]|nr:hypothetical protein [Campylobacterota bacterium]